mgnify:CR=1 FL=1
MSDYGVKISGFVRPRLEELRANFREEYIAEFGNINTDEDAVFGQLIGVQAKIFADQWEALEEAYNAMYRSTAEGVPLENAVEFIGISRNPATSTTVVGVLIGQESATIDAGAQARVSATGDVLSLSASTTIERASLLVADLEIQTAIDATAYVVLLNGAVITYTSGAGATVESIATGLAALIDADSLVTASATGETITVTAADGRTSFGLSPQDAKITLSRLGTPGFFAATSTGAVVVPVGALDEIETARAGWDEVTNLVAGATGLETESDEDLRARATRSVRVAGSSTLLAIRSRIEEEVDSVSTVIVYENRTLVTDFGGRPAKSIEVIVDGGDDQEIADKIWEVKAAGIETFGNTSQIVVDSNGDGQIVSFTRPEDVFIWVRVTVDSLYGEETLPATAIEAIQAAVVSYGATLPIGREVHAQRIITAILRPLTGANPTVPGSDTLTVEMALGDESIDPGVYSSTTIPINERSVARFATARIAVTLP